MWASVGLSLLAACGPPPSIATKVRGAADGTLALSVDGSLVYAVSADDNTLVVVDPAAKTVVATVAVGKSPARVIVGPDDTIFVSNRDSRSVSVIHKGTWSEASHIAVGAEPIGLALSPSADTLFVANRASGTVQAIDLTASAPAVRWETSVGELPRGVAALADGRLYVSHERSGMVDVLDGAHGAVLKSVSTAVGAVPALTRGFTMGPGGSTAETQPTFRPTALDSVVLSHDGKRAYLAHRRERSGIISDTNFVPVVAPALSTVELSSDTVHDDSLEATQTYPPTIVYPDNQVADLTVAAPGVSFGGSSSSGSSGSGYGGSVPAGSQFGWTQGPSALVEDPAGNFLYVANVNSGDVTVLPTHRRSGADASNGLVAQVLVGDGPTGLALSTDQTTLFVHNALSRSLSIVTSVNGTLQETARIEAVGTAGSLPSDVVEGRRMFFSASDSTMSAPGSGVACESCHFEGGTDGNVWQFIQGPRRTPGLFGKHLQSTAPYHWDGTENTLHILVGDATRARMGGSGPDDTQATQIGVFVAQLTVADNPNVGAGGLTTQQQHGQALFAATCASCHAGSDFTDNGFHDVGTQVTSNPNGRPDDLCRLTPSATGCIVDTSLLTAAAAPSNTNGGFNTPTLLGLALQGPYLHDGSARTLADVINSNSKYAYPGAQTPGQVVNLHGGHGQTQSLSGADVQDLVAYLETL